MTTSPGNIHGVAVAAGDLGLLILGASGAGKSALAARMLSNWPFGSVRLVADDRVLISARGGLLVARPHSAIAEKMELRGVGIVQPATLEAVVVRGVLRLNEAPPPRLPDEDQLREELLGIPVPVAHLPTGYAAYPRLITIWPYFCVQMRNDLSNIATPP